MNLLNILEAICDHVKAAFPDYPIYIMQVPQGFKRPSFYVNLIGFSDRDLCMNGLRRQAAFEVVYFAQQDAKGITNPVTQLAVFEQLMQIFQVQSLPVQDRFLKITRVDGSTRDSEVYLTISFEYTFTPDINRIDPELMQQLLTRYN
jgi:hypothetical protein